jgi:hypothetical protein
MLTDAITQQGAVPMKFGDETKEACAKAGIAKVADQLKP